MIRWGMPIRCWIPLLLMAVGFNAITQAQPQPEADPAQLLQAQASAPPLASPGRGDLAPFVERYCIDCHDQASRSGGLDLESIVGDELSRQPQAWEKVLRRLATRQMPPAKASRPDEATYRSVVTSLGNLLDQAAAEHPDPGRTDTFRRLNRTEYQNAIRDLLALEIDASGLLPGDESSHGFDNVTVGDLSPTLLDRSITAAQKISRLAIGTSGRSPGGETIRIRADLTQEEHVEGLPVGTRGGALITYQFPQDGDYEIQLRLARDRNEHVEGLHEPHELDVLLDRKPMARFTLTPPRGDHEHESVDQALKVVIPVTAGPHKLGVTFVKKPSSLRETKRQPYQAHFNMHRHPRISPALFQVSITGPHAAKGFGDTPSRRRIFIVRPTDSSQDEACARQILATLMRRAYRRPVTDADLQTPLEFYREASAEGGFDAGIEMALSAILVNPQFLFRVERDPPGLAPGTAYRISDLELASRLSFFLWSSIPDDELLDLAERNELSQPERLRQQVLRMLADPRSQTLVTNFASQWLHLRNLESITPDLRLFPDFDDNLRQAFRQETELFLECVLREDRSVLELLSADFTFLNERLAKHYDIPNIYGSRFRRVALGRDRERGGLLRQGSILTVTSYATRTSPVLRGKWVLDNFLGTPPPPPPANIPALKDNTVSTTLSVRERLAEHRANIACAGCHNLMDPIGFALEGFDAVGRWRDVEEARPIDTTGGLPDGSRFDGVAGLEQALRERPEIFVGTLAEKLMTFALGRGVEPYDGPAIRKVVRTTQADDNRFSSLIMGIATSTPFQMRKSE